MAKKIKKYRGVSLIEMILVVAVSSIIALAVGQIFLSSLKSFEKDKQLQKNLEDARSSMELMAKNIRMSKYTTRTVSGGNVYLFMYNTSQNQCVSYQFDLGQKKLKSAYCNPKTDAVSGLPVGSTGSIDDQDICSSSAVCTGSGYSYGDMTGDNISGDFYVLSTNRTTVPYAVGRATIRMTVGTDPASEKTIQTSVSFRDYEDILQ